jgi:radical SAM superfamily enzyme YgiQ (UPF0313 family)
MADVVLVFPKSSFLDKAFNHHYAPLSLLGCATYLDDYKVKIIDQRTDPKWEMHLRKEASKSPLVIGITSLTGEQIRHGLHATRVVKEHSETKVLWGGVHPSILPKQTLEHPQIDMVMQGEAEDTFRDLTTALDKGTALKNVPGLYYKEKGRMISNAPSKPVDITKLPEPPYKLLDMEDYILRYGSDRMFIMESSRGCPYKCAFCYVQGSSTRPWRALSAKATVERMKSLKEKYRLKGIEFQDLNSFVDLKRMTEISKLLIDEKVDMFWNTCGRISDVNRMSHEDLKLHERSGLRRLALGVESGSDRVLALMQKGITRPMVIDASIKLRKTSIEPVYSFMAGFPTETEQELHETTSLVTKLLKENKKAKSTILHCYRPLPGNGLYNLAVSKGLVPPTTLAGWGRYEMEKIDYPYLSRRMQKRISALNFLSLFLDKKYEEVDSGLVRAFAKLYGPIARYRFRNYDFRLMLEPKLKDLFTSM